MRKKRSKSLSPAECSQCGYQPATASMAFCPGCGCSFAPATVSRTRRRIGWLSVPQMLYQTAYKWFVYISALDVILTWVILVLGGKEVNVLADSVIAHAGLKGILIYKFCLVILVVLICEIIGRRRFRLGRNLARLAIVITALPVILSVAQLVSAWA
ncbi:MAG: DUF5658 family protein [Planctomycetota bacterium]